MLRLLVILFLVVVLLLLEWPQGGGDEPVAAGPRIVCVAGEKFVRCPAECETGPDGEARCRCQDFWYRRGEQPLQFSHSLCR